MGNLWGSCTRCRIPEEIFGHGKGKRPWQKGERGLGKKEPQLVILRKIGSVEDMYFEDMYLIHLKTNFANIICETFKYILNFWWLNIEGWCTDSCKSFFGQIIGSDSSGSIRSCGIFPSLSTHQFEAVPLFILSTWIIAMAVLFPYLFAMKLYEYPEGSGCQMH